MQPWSRFIAGLRNLLRKPQVESQLDDEVRAYVDMVADERMASGMAPSEARRTALADFGGVEQVKQAVRNGRAGTFAESLGQDVRYGFRQLRRNPAFTWTAVITLGLGIGATTTIFSAVYAHITLAALLDAACPARRAYSPGSGRRPPSLGTVTMTS